VLLLTWLIQSLHYSDDSDDKKTAIAAATVTAAADAVQVKEESVSQSAWVMITSEAATTTETTTSRKYGCPHFIHMQYYHAQYQRPSEHKHTSTACKARRCCRHGGNRQRQYMVYCNTTLRNAIQQEHYSAGPGQVRSVQVAQYSCAMRLNTSRTSFIRKPAVTSKSLSWSSTTRSCLQIASSPATCHLQPRLSYPL
jgi:hypothetical protein